MHPFTYTLKKAGRIVRKGKGTALYRDVQAVESYLEKRYARRRWDEFEHEFHGTESAALKAETKSIAGYERATGALPPWNDRSGGGGGRRFKACKATKADGTGCQNLAIKGNYGFCGVHR